MVNFVQEQAVVHLLLNFVTFEAVTNIAFIMNL